jgi:hypothetical protein
MASRRTMRSSDGHGVSTLTHPPRVSEPVEKAVSAAPAIAGEMNGARRIVPVATSWVARDVATVAAGFS